MACVLPLTDGCVVVGTDNGRLVLHRLNPEGQWHEAASETVHASIAVDSIHALLPGLLLVNCAGELSVRSLPDLKSVEGGAIVTRCTGALCLQEKSFTAMNLSQRIGPESEVRLCAATHLNLVLHDVDNGADDAQVGPTRLRSKHFARISLNEPVGALLWRDQHICVAHCGCYVVLDATSGAETWRVHLTSTGSPLVVGSPASGCGDGGGDGGGMHSADAASHGSACSASETSQSLVVGNIAGAGAGGRRTGGGAGGSHRRMPSETDVATLLLAGRFEGNDGGADERLSVAASSSASEIARSKASARPEDELWLVEQMVWVDHPNAASAMTMAVLGNGTGGGGVAGGHHRRTESGSSSAGSWQGERRGQCWLDVAREVWYREREEAQPLGPKACWGSGWRIAFTHPTDAEGWQYAPRWEAGAAAWVPEHAKGMRVRRRKWVRTMRAALALPALSSSDTSTTPPPTALVSTALAHGVAYGALAAPAAATVGGGLLLPLAGGQQLLMGEMGGSRVSLLFDLKQLSMRPCIVWEGQAPDAVASAPPLLLAYFSASRVLATFHLATGERIGAYAVEPSSTAPERGDANDASRAWTGDCSPPLLAVRGSDILLVERGRLTCLRGVHLGAHASEDHRRCEEELRRAATAMNRVGRGSGVGAGGGSSSAGFGASHGQGAEHEVDSGDTADEEPANAAANATNAASLIVRAWLCPDSGHPLGTLLGVRASEFSARFEPVIAAAKAALEGTGADGSRPLLAREQREATECSMCSGVSRNSLESDAVLGEDAGGGALSKWEANRQIDDAVSEVQAMNGVLDESLVAQLPQVRSLPNR